MILLAYMACCSCTVLDKDQNEIRKIEHDAVDYELDRIERTTHEGMPPQKRVNIIKMKMPKAQYKSINEL